MPFDFSKGSDTAPEPDVSRETDSDRPYEDQTEDNRLPVEFRPADELTEQECKDEIVRLERVLSTPDPLVRLDQVRLAHERILATKDSQ